MCGRKISSHKIYTYVFRIKRKSIFICKIWQFNRHTHTYGIWKGLCDWGVRENYKSVNVLFVVFFVLCDTHNSHLHTSKGSPEKKTLGGAERPKKQQQPNHILVFSGPFLSLMCLLCTQTSAPHQNQMEWLFFFFSFAYSLMLRKKCNFVDRI